MFKKLKIRRLESKMDQMDARAKSLREGAADSDWRGLWNFFNEQELRDYSVLAEQHYMLTGSYDYFSPKVHALANEPNSPKGLMTVTKDTHDTFEVKWLRSFNSKTNKIESILVTIRNGVPEKVGWALFEHLEEETQKFILEQIKTQGKS